MLGVPASAQTIFLEIAGIEGEVTERRFEGTIAVDAAGFGGEVAVSYVGGGGTAGRVNFGPLTVAKPYDSASPLLALWMAQGRVIDEVTVYYVVERDGALVERARTTLTNVLVSSISMSAVDGAPPRETVTFAYGTIEWSVTTFRPDGGAEPPVVEGWNIESNMEL